MGVMENSTMRKIIAFFACVGICAAPIFFAAAQSQDSVSLSSFFIFPDKINVYNIQSQEPFSQAGKKFVFKTISSVPPGFDFPQNGVLAWFPTPNEYKDLKKNPVEIVFEARASEGDSTIKGVIKVVAEKVEKGENPIASAKAASATTGREEAKDTLAEDSLEIKLPGFKNWNEKKEGEVFSFKISAKGGAGDYVFRVRPEEKVDFTFEDNGYFYWEPGYGYVEGDNTLRGSRFKFLVRDAAGSQDSVAVDLVVHNTNRAPIVNELPTFYVQWEKENVYQLKLEGIVYDEDKDAIVFQPVLAEMPQGMTLTKDGEIKWKPSVRQFIALRKEPLKIRFIVKDVPYGDETTGIARFEVTQQDLPPQLTMVPDNDLIEIDENESLNLGFFLNDPNGEEDIAVFDFVSDNNAVGPDALKSTSGMQYEFKWTPGYSFVQEAGGSEEFSITFYAFDRGNNRTEKQVRVKVNDAENIAEMDRLLYFQYRTVLATAFELVQQLSEKEDELKKNYKKAKNGKRKRAIANASLGAITGLSPVFLEGQTQKMTVGIGGTATATIGTLEASNVIGNPPSDIMEQWTYVTAKKNEILLHGNVFAGKYAQKIERRKSSFQNDLKNLTFQMNLKDMTKLELDASWESSKEATDKNIKKVFKDFYPNEEYAVR